MEPVYIIAFIFSCLIGIVFFMNSYTALEIMILIFFVVMIAIIGSNYFFGVQLTTTLNNLFKKAEINIGIVEPTEKHNGNDVNDNNDNSNNDNNDNDNKTKMYKPQAYHVYGQYDYPTSKAICKAYNGKLANVHQMKDAHQKGAEWCDYGWSEDSMVLYPTQEKSWQRYQETDQHDRCGIPGINGGYNKRTGQKLGVNCFGPKPHGKMPETPYPVEKVDERTAYWKSQSLNISPFNYNSWSEL